MVNFDSIRNSTLIKSPFKYSIIAKCFTDEVINKLLSNMPSGNYYRSIRKLGSDKNYNVINNLLLKLGDKKYNEKISLGACWISLIAKLQNTEYITALSDLLQEDLSKCHQEITLKIYGYRDFISAHTDKANVKATHMIFLNKDWDEEWGGQLCFMYNESNVFKRFSPISDHSVAFVRAENSWHSVEKIREPIAERIAIQVAFWNVTERKVLPGRIEKTVSL
jgi:Rps23 Pro-64 3,4-dihydroxylase Tpa1-like proline 4-hydroxylase